MSGTQIFCFTDNPISVATNRVTEKVSIDHKPEVQFAKRPEENNYDWMFFFFIFILVAGAAVKKFYGSAAADPLRYFFGLFKGDEDVPHSVFTKNIYAVWFAIAATGTGMFSLFILNAFFDPGLNSLSSFGAFVVFTLGAAVAAFIKLLIYQLGMLLFNLKGTIVPLLKYYFGYLITVGIILLGVSVLIAYFELLHEKVFIYSGLVVAGILFLVFIWKIIFTYIFEYKFSAFYIILYLCGLEILPVLIAGKWLKTLI